jgi:hypothetical protein
VVIGWLTRIAVALAVVFVIGYDGIALTASHLGAVDDANQAASDAASSWRTSHDLQAAAMAAAAVLPASETLIPTSLVIATDGSVQLQVHRVTATLIAQDVPGVKKWVAFTVTGTASAPVS